MMKRCVASAALLPPSQGVRAAAFWRDKYLQRVLTQPLLALRLQGKHFLELRGRQNVSALLELPDFATDCGTCRTRPLRLIDIPPVKV